MTDEDIRRRRYRRIRAGAAQDEIEYIYPISWIVYLDTTVAISAGTPNYIAINSFDDDFNIGDTWRITWDGVDYVLTPHYAPDNQTLIIGNFGIEDPLYDDGSGVPFYAFKYSAYVCAFGTHHAPGTITLKIEKRYN